VVALSTAPPQTSRNTEKYDGNNKQEDVAVVLPTTGAVDETIHLASVDAAVARLQGKDDKASCLIAAGSGGVIHDNVARPLVICVVSSR
jgi:hypothetical protein